MNLKSELKGVFRKRLIEVTGEIWYHGTPDVRELEKEGVFINRNTSIEHITDLRTYNELQDKLLKARENGDDDKYHKLLDMVPKLKDKYTMKKPIFLTNKHNIAKTYADSRRSIDYQNAKEDVLKVNVSGGKALQINAIGDKFRFISVPKVRRGFMDSGVSEEEFNEVLNKFNFHVNLNKGIKTDVVGAMAQYFNFDYVDVIGVLDSYEGGNEKSTVRMVFDPTKLKIVR